MGDDASIIISTNLPVILTLTVQYSLGR